MELLERTERGPVRACISVPPRHGKTELLLHFIAWWLLRHPDRTVAYVSYAAAVARSKSRAARDYAAAAGVVLRDDVTALGEWRTPQGGGVLATGIGGALTGHGCGMLLVDDPTKNRAEADSPLLREQQWQWFTSTALTRLEPGASAFVVHTRWHKHDLIGRCIAESGRDGGPSWDVVNLPAIDSSGHALWESRWPVEALELRRGEVGEHDWQSLYQGAPVARRGRVYPAFERGRHVKQHADLEAMFRSASGWKFRRVVSGLDFGWSHPGACVVVGVTGDDEVYILEEFCKSNLLFAERHTDGTPGWLAELDRLNATHQPERYFPDPSSPNNIAAMRGHFGGWPLVEDANNDVAEGIRRVQILLGNGPRGTPRLFVSDRCPQLIDELESYSYRAGRDGLSEVPQDTKDDACDALRYAIAGLRLD